MGQIARTLTLHDSTIEDDFSGRALKVAFATTDQKHVDQHFGTCEFLSVYLVTRDEAHFHQTVGFEEAQMDGTEDKLDVRLKALEDCAAVYCRAVGASAIAQLKQIRVQPVKVADGTPIKAQLALLQDELRGDPSFWILRALNAVNDARNDPARFDDMEMEGWSE
ncbi:nitrogen fixation protein NifX [Cohaesibacter sp. ES.047]|uniref:NifB/NifX family molybdenum-iron cluster-binding protein n=1 Tax=Cohaesibacter sp. ES.047 TaxID=1798205 RepID=UPI000BBF84A4|nr:NifB/NifX family molybdenum-iron cluster-binding protein [Cohaesibacter sp. ES.047]SNY92926.1 nitrogen fixation protein NifX [Cohaesibacter sp. ES.047]